MLVDIDPFAPWVPELLCQPYDGEATELSVSAEELALVRVGWMVDRMLSCGWKGLGRLWRPSLQHDLLLLAEQCGPDRVDPDVLRGLLPHRQPWTRRFPFARRLASGCAAVCLLPELDEHRIMAIVDLTVPGGWCAWSIEQRLAFLDVLTKVLATTAPKNIGADDVRAMVGAVDVTGMLAGGRGTASAGD